MTQRALAVASLAVVVVWAGTSLLAGSDKSKAIYTCGTVPGAVKRSEGRLNTWNLSALSFRPDSRSTKPMLIRYKSITRLEYGGTPPDWLETPEAPPITLPCALKRQDRYLTIFYEEVPADEDENKDTAQSKDPKDQETQDQKDRRERAERRDRTDPANPTNRNRTERMERTERSDQKDQKDLKKEKKYFAVFELGDGVLRPTLRVLETRSGKRIQYQDAGARKAAR